MPPMPKTRRRGTRNRGNDPAALAARLPVELRGFDPWLYSETGPPTGLRDYWGSLAEWIDGQEADPRVIPLVMTSTGLNYADWYRLMMTRTTE